MSILKKIPWKFGLFFTLWVVLIKELKVSLAESYQKIRD